MKKHETGGTFSTHGGDDKRMEAMINAYKILTENLKGRDN
jgi:hypothetical protein